METVNEHYNPYLGDANEFIKNNKGLAYKIACRFRHTGLEWEDLEGSAMLGLYKAYLKYDPSFTNPDGNPVAFSTYAVPMIQGEIQRMLREDSRGCPKFPRTVKEDFNFLSKIGDLDLYNGDPAVIHARTGMEISRIESVMEYARSGRGTASLQAPVDTKISDGEEVTLIDTIIMTEQDPLFSIYVEEFKNNYLPKNLVPVFEGMLAGKRQREIGEEIGVGQVQVSRLEQKVKKIAAAYFGVGNSDKGEYVVPRRMSKERQEQKEEAIALIKEGKMSISQIAKKFGFTYQSVLRWRDKIRIEERKGEVENYYLPPKPINPPSDKSRESYPDDAKHPDIVKEPLMISKEGTEEIGEMPKKENIFEDSPLFKSGTTLLKLEHRVKRVSLKHYLEQVTEMLSMVSDDSNSTFVNLEVVLSISEEEEAS